jgi:hypothetical protein
VQVRGLRRDRRLAVVEDALERVLLGQRIDQRHRRDHVLPLDGAPGREAPHLCN